MDTNIKKSIRFINRDALKYIALFLMVTGHLIIYTGFRHYVFLPKPLIIAWLINTFVF